MGEKGLLLTVIVPAYNVEKYLEECLDSLINQTEIDHKAIIVNDGSTDRTGEIAKSYAEKYPHMFYYVEQENRGLGAARNIGMALADTPYITFLDSDDWWECHYIERIKREIERQEEAADIIFTLPWIYDTATGRIMEWYDKLLLEQLFYPYGEEENVPSKVININSERGLELYNLEANACRRIYRMEFLKSIKFLFPVGVKWEDVEPHFYELHYAKRCIAVKSTGFFYRINTGNQITAGSGVTRLDIISVFSNILQKAIREKWNDKEIMYILRMLWSFSLWSIEVTNTEYIESLLEGLHKLFKNIPRKYFAIYLKLCSPQRLKESVLTFVLCSPFYNVLKDYRTRQMGLSFCFKIRHIKNKIWR